MCIKGKIISSLGVSVLAFNVLLSTPIFANEHEASLEIQNEERYTPVSYTHLTLPTIISVCRSRWSPYH